VESDGGFTAQQPPLLSLIPRRPSHALYSSEIIVDYEIAPRSVHFYSIMKKGVESDEESGGSYESGSSYESEGDSLSGSWSSSSSSSSNRTQSNDDYSQNSSVYSTESKSSSASSYSTSTAATQNDKNGDMLEVSRDKSLSAKQRQAKMNQIMAGGTGKQYTPAGSIGNKKTGKSRFEDSVHEVNFDDDVDIKPQRTSRDKLQNQKVSALIKRLGDDDPAFTSISLSREKLTDGDIVPLLGALRINKTVTTLNLSHNRISSKGASSIATSLTGTSVLREVDVSGNHLGDGGIRHLSEALPYAKSLKVLELEENSITDAGVLSLAETINESSLERLNLNGNQIGDAASSLFKHLASNEKMTTLELNSNKISDKGATELASALLDNETLLAVDLGENEVTNRGANDLLKVLRVNDTLEELELAGNASVTDEMMEMIQAVLGEEDYSSSDGESESENDASCDDSAKRERKLIGREGGAETAQPEMGANAMLTDMPDETDNALAKRRAIQTVMQDRSLSPQERNAKIQEIMSNRVELPPVPVKAKTFGKRRSSLDNFIEECQEASKSLRHVDDPDTAEKRAERRKNIVEADKAKPKGPLGLTQNLLQDKRSGLKATPNSSLLNINDGCEESWSDNDDVGSGANAMLTDMPDETNAALGKRLLIQAVMQEKSLSAQERNKKIQDIMSGRVELPKVDRRRKTQTPTTNDQSHGKRDQMNSRITTATGTSTAASNSESTGAEAMLTDMPDENDTALRKRQLIREIMQNKNLSAMQRNQKIQDVMAGRVELPSLREKDPPSLEIPEAIPNNIDKERESPGALKNSSGLSTGSQVKSDQRHESSRSSGRSRRRKSNSFRRESQTSTNVVAHEWKKRMMAVHPKSHDDLLDVLLAHKYRLSLKVPPNQSFFRVVCVVFFSRRINGNLREERFHVVGTNDEPSAISGSICAERAALMQIRFIPDIETVTKLVIVTDEVDAISPGLLCREFMASHGKIPWDVPIVLGRSVCRKCGLTLSGKACGDSDGCFDMSSDETLKEKFDNVFATCQRGHDESKNKAFPTPHDFVGSVTTLKELFPFPSIYVRMTAREAHRFGEIMMDQTSSKNPLPRGSSTKDDDDVTTGSFRQERFDLTMLTSVLEEGGPPTSEVTMDDSSKGVDTNGSLVTAGGKAQRHSSITKSLTTTMGLLKAVRENRQELDLPGGVSGMSDLPGTLEHLTARTLRISTRLKNSQRREKLMRYATEITALENPLRHAHPLRYGAAVLFSDGTVSIASQKVALEYGCTLDAVGQLASAIDKKAIRVVEEEDPCRPVLLVQCDQFGIAHAPFAQGRAFLSERGYGDCKVLIHQKRQIESTIKEEPDGDSDADEDEKNEECVVKLRLIEVEANDLCPSPPDIFGELVTKTHSQQHQVGGLHIQF